MDQIKNLVLILVKKSQNFAWVNIKIIIIFICLLTENESVSLKQITKISIFQLSFVKSVKVSLKENVSGFSVDYEAIDKSDILNICNYLMVKTNIK